MFYTIVNCFLIFMIKIIIINVGRDRVYILKINNFSVLSLVALHCIFVILCCLAADICCVRSSSSLH